MYLASCSQYFTLHRHDYPSLYKRTTRTMSYCYYTGTNSDWNDFVHEQALIWERTVLAWVSNNHNHPVLVVKYEDLKNETVAELKRMLDFLQVPSKWTLTIIWLIFGA